MTKTLLQEMTSRECNEYQVQGGDIMIVPVGSIEVLGPHLPVASRCYVADAFSRLLAEQVKGLCLPVTPYSCAPHTHDRQGSLDIPESAVISYIRAVMDDLLATGFRRILLVTYLDYLRYYTPQEVYEDHNVAAAGIHLGEHLPHHGKKAGIGEDSFILGALRLLGRHELAAKVEGENQRHLESGVPVASLPESVVTLNKVGAIGFTYPSDGYPLPPSETLSGEKGEQALREAAAELVPAVADLRNYNDYLTRRTNSRGLLWRGWRSNL